MNNVSSSFQTFTSLTQINQIMSHHPKNQIASGSDLYSSKSELSGLKKNKIGKSQSDYESAWSPTSPLDFRLFSSLGNPFGGYSSSRSIRKVHQKSWDSGKVGLSIVDSLDDPHRHTDSLLPSSPDSKSIIFGSWMRIGNPKSHQPFAKTPMPKEDKPNVDLTELDSSCLVSASENISVSNSACQVMKQTPEGSLEFSEDYTCVISHGPNPKTTHFYGDQVLETLEHNVVKKGCCGDEKESIFEIAPLDLTTVTDDVLPSDDFLSFCCFCTKKLRIGKDIYMYRGYKAFCSSECRSEVIHVDDEKMEEEEEDEEEEEEEEAESGSSSDNDLFKKKSNGVVFTVG